MPTFIGIDLAWKSDLHHTGGAVLQGDDRSVELTALSADLRELQQIEAFVSEHATADTVVAIDAPLIIKNRLGQRPCETEVSRRFGGAHAGAHTSNLTLYPDARSVCLAKALQAQGYQHCPSVHEPRCKGTWMLEVYPHPAQVVLFGRDRIIRYKKGRIAERRSGLEEFRASIRRHLGQGRPALTPSAALDEFLAQALGAAKGLELKHYEDKLDALFCAYLAAFFWAWAYERTEMIGTHETGYIIVPLSVQ